MSIAFPMKESDDADESAMDYAGAADRDLPPARKVPSPHLRRTVEAILWRYQDQNSVAGALEVVITVEGLTS
jgi:hypothetical protein